MLGGVVPKGKRKTTKDLCVYLAVPRYWKSMGFILHFPQFFPNSIQTIIIIIIIHFICRALHSKISKCYRV